MSKRDSSSKNRNSKKDDDVLLDERIADNKIEYPQQLLLAVGFVVSFLPAYLAHAVYNVDWRHFSNIPAFIAVPSVTAFMLSRAYGVMIESEFWKRQPHYDETKGTDVSLLRNLRLQVAIGYTMFLLNGLFFVLSTLCQAYVFRKNDPRFAFVISPLLASSLLWFVALKNEESRKRRMGRV